MKIFTYTLAALLMLSLVSAVNPDIECQDNGFDYGVSKWQCSKGFTLEESMFNETSWSTSVTGNCQAADWEADPDVAGVLVKAGPETVVTPGGSDGNISGIVKSCKMVEDKDNCIGTGRAEVCAMVEECVINDISHVTFCGNGGGDPGCTDPNGCDNGVPEFSTLTLGIAVLTATMGLVYLRKH